VTNDLCIVHELVSTPRIPQGCCYIVNILLIAPVSVFYLVTLLSSQADREILRAAASLASTRSFRFTLFYSAPESHAIMTQRTYPVPGLSLTRFVTLGFATGALLDYLSHRMNSDVAVFVRCFYHTLLKRS
jgi:hypothetical protein